MRVDPIVMKLQYTRIYDCRIDPIVQFIAVTLHAGYTVPPSVPSSDINKASWHWLASFRRACFTHLMRHLGLKVEVLFFSTQASNFVKLTSPSSNFNTNTMAKSLLQCQCKSLAYLRCMNLNFGDILVMTDA